MRYTMHIESDYISRSIVLFINKQIKMATIKLIDYNSAITKQSQAKEIYKQIKDNRPNDNVVVVDFDNIETMTIQCAKIIFGQLYIELGPYIFYKNIVIDNCTDNHYSIIDFGIEQAVKYMVEDNYKKGDFLYGIPSSEESAIYNPEGERVFIYTGYKNGDGYGKLLGFHNHKICKSTGWRNFMWGGEVRKATEEEINDFIMKVFNSENIKNY